MNRMLLVSITAAGLMLASLVQAVPYDIQTIQQNMLVQAVPELPDLSRYTRQAVLEKQAKWHKKNRKSQFRAHDQRHCYPEIFQRRQVRCMGEKTGAIPESRVCA